MVSRILSLKASIIWLVGETRKGVRSQFLGGQTTPAVRLTMRSSKIGLKTSIVASAVWHVLLKPNVAVQHGPIKIVIDCNGHSLLIFEEKCPNYASGPKSAPNSAGFPCPKCANIRMQFSHTFCKTTMILKVMSQYFPALFKRISNYACLAEG